MLYAVVPVKSLVRAKTRLAPLLSFTQRRLLARRFLHDTLDLLTRHPGAARTIVVSADAAVIGFARSRRMIALPQTATGGLNRAVELGCRLARRRGATAVLVLPTDLPALDVASLRRFTQPASTPVIRIAADRHGSGSNALYLQPGRIGFARFGPVSLQRHRDMATASGIRAEIVTEPAFNDVDLPADIDAALSIGPRSAKTI